MVAVLVSLCNLIDRDMGTLLVGMLNLNGVDVIAKCYRYANRFKSDNTHIGHCRDGRVHCIILFILRIGMYVRFVYRRRPGEKQNLHFLCKNHIGPVTLRTKINLERFLFYFFYKIGWKKLFQRTAANNKDFVIYYLVTSQSEHLIPTEVAILDETML